MENNTLENKIFKNHPLIPFVIDSLSRYERNQLILASTQSDKIHQAFIKSITQHLDTENVPHSLKDYKFIYFDARQFFSGDMNNTHSINSEKNLQHFQMLIAQLKKQHQKIIFVISQIDFLTQPMLDQLLNMGEWRIIGFVSQISQLHHLTLSPFFSIANFTEPSLNELISVLKIHRVHLENFHQVTIPDELILNAYNMADHYLPGHSQFDKTFELLDSAAARASINHQSHDKKAIVTSHCLMEVISNKTQIPLTHLHNNNFQAHKFIETLRKNIVGQDAAMNMIASRLQNACIKLLDHSGPLCSFLLVGPHDAGKTEMAYAMADHLFGGRHALLRVNLNLTEYTSLADITIFPVSNENPETHLLSAIQQMPYAIILIEDIDRLHHKTFDLIQGIFEPGYVFDEQHRMYDFRHAIIIATTRAGSDFITQSTGSHQTEEPGKTIDLMQLVLNEHVHDSRSQSIYPSTADLCEELTPKLLEHFPQVLLQKLNVIPFLPLDYAALEKIIRAKIKMLGRRLQSSFGIELSFAPEVIKFLAHETVWRKANVKSLDKLLEQQLYSIVTHEILLHAENKNRSKRLFIQLNESGHLLRCEFMTSNEAAFYDL